MLRVHVSCACGVNIESYLKLKVLIKKFAMCHAKKEPDVLSHEETHKGLESLSLDSNSKDSQHEIGKHYELP